MSKEDLIESPGVIEAAMGGGQYSIVLDGGTKVHAKLSGKMKQRHIRVIPGDRVTVGMSPYDLTHGIITWRFK